MAFGTNVPDATDNPANTQTIAARTVARNLLAARMLVSVIPDAGHLIGVS